MAATHADRRFFGHPTGLAVLAGTELWERFSFYGMQAILMLYMTKQLLLPATAPHVWGLTAFRGLFGPLDDTAFAAQTFGLYSGLVYATPLLGSWLGDRVIGKVRAVVAGAVLMAAGHLAMASTALFLAALSLIILGAGLLVGNMSAQVGTLYAPADARRTRAFAVYLIALNVGALFSPLVVGTLGEKVGWHYGFAAAGMGMLVALVTYLAGRRHLPPDRVVRHVGVRPPLTRAEKRSIAGVLLVLIPYVLCNAAFQQAYGIMLVWADGAVDRRVLGFELPVSWVLFADGVMTIVSVALATAIWKRLAARGREPGDIAKSGIGYALVAAAFVYAALIARMPVIPVAALIVFYAILDSSAGWWDPPVNALISRNAPASLAATMMALGKLATALGYFLLGWLGRFYEPLGPSLYWAFTASLALAGLAMVIACGARVSRMLDPKVSADVQPAPLTAPAAAA